MDQHEPIELVLKSERDDIFDGENYPRPFAFNQEVVRVFDDMVSRSIPLYKEVTRASAEWALRFYQEGTNIYDVGCSTGTTLAALAEIFHAYRRPVGFVGIDNSTPMIDKAKEKMKRWGQYHAVELVTGDIRKQKMQNASVVIVNYTLQFLPVSQRKDLLIRIHDAMVPGGILILSEKVRGGCPEFHEAMTHIYEQFKQENGYSRTEIERKKEALEHVLVPLTYDEQVAMLEDAGFNHTESVIKWNNFLTTVSLAR